MEANKIEIVEALAAKLAEAERVLCALALEMVDLYQVDDYAREQIAVASNAISAVRSLLRLRDDGLKAAK